MTERVWYIEELTEEDKQNIMDTCCQDEDEDADNDTVSEK